MPELPEVQTVVNTLRPAVLGCRFRRVALARPDIVEPAGTDLAARLAGRRVRDLCRRGKRIIFRLDSPVCLVVHLGMTGRLIVAAAEEVVPPHTHLLADLAGLRGPRQLRFIDPRRFGFLLLTDDPSAGLGPEPLDLTHEQLRGLLEGTRRAVKTALLDQSLLAGLGNIYADESLHLARIHPCQIARNLTAGECLRLVRAIRRTLRAAIENKGTTLRDYVDADGRSGENGPHLRVYGREGQPCPACRTPIRRIVLNGRSAHFCPRCQPSA